ncbi:hypothetical protein M422DRAFT_268989 [Sphaerobolus stellatus SS14]|uniref:Uncharacterized protein n=1 Tax=Sphaerobolus stellatus (strain SS14) TaxID=990650 RepID=A0A0C9UWD6_SPHS4|nr:hypothetical protein M422DRAFT_268989 [Sphaerobolus stellatus SS14]
MTEANAETPSATPAVEGSNIQSTLRSSQASGSTDDTATGLVRKCLSIVECRRKGEICTSEAISLLLGELPASEDGERALEQYIDMCVEIDRESVLAGEKGKQLTDRLQDSQRDEEIANRPQQEDFPVRPDIPLNESGDLNREGETKKVFDRSKLSWFKRPEPFLNPAVKETLERKRFYLANYKEVKHDLLEQADCPAFPDSLWHDVIIGNFVDLDKVYTGRYSLEPDTDTSKSSKEVRTHSEWTVAFHSAKSAILFLYPNRKEEFAAYEAFIIGQFAATRPEEHRRVIALDKAIRKEAAKVNNCTLTTVPSFNATH